MQEKQKTLKLFVWHRVFNDYSNGIAFAMAHDIKEAKALIVKDLQLGDCRQVELDVVKPKVYTAPFGTGIFGGCGD